MVPANDGDFSRRWAYVKKFFTKQWLAANGEEQIISDSQQKNRRRGVWQRRFWEHAIRNKKDYEQHCDYIHYNPVKHGLVKCPHLWKYSSFSQFVCEGRYQPDWGCECEKPVKAPRFDEIENSVGE